jgi:hypothetical protein
LLANAQLNSGQPANAAKYGALSNPAGELHIGWTHDNEELTLEWREKGGPTVFREYVRLRVAAIQS